MDGLCGVWGEKLRVFSEGLFEVVVVVVGCCYYFGLFKLVLIICK